MTNNDIPSSTRVVLPDHIVPHRYDLKITPDLVSFTFEGECRIALTTKTVEGLESFQNNEIQLHAKELYFISANLIIEGSSDPPIECEEVRILGEPHFSYPFCIH
jgi:aminopeptidase N